MQCRGDYQLFIKAKCVNLGKFNGSRKKLQTLNSYLWLRCYFCFSETGLVQTHNCFIIAHGR